MFYSMSTICNSRHPLPTVISALKDCLKNIAKAFFQKSGSIRRQGIQFLPFNTLYQLYAQTLSKPDVLQKAASFLFIADYFHFILSGVATIEKTMASTSQMWNIHQNSWDTDIADSLAVSKKALLLPVVPGSKVGHLTLEMQQKTGLTDIPIIAPASHDTASAVLAVPAKGSNWAYLSSGTWSLLGIEIDEPIINDKALQANWTNEGGYADTFRFLKNITGLWIIQEIARVLKDRYSFGELAEMARQEGGFISLINPDAPCFFSPENMIDAIKGFCRQTGQKVPETPGQLVRCAYDSLGLLYHKTLEDLRDLSRKKIEVLHIIGGGSRADLLNQLTASITGIPVLAGPVEATALGNALAQLLATDAIDSLARGRELIGASFPVQRFEPEHLSDIETIRKRFGELCMAQSNIKEYE